MWHIKHLKQISFEYFISEFGKKTYNGSHFEDLKQLSRHEKETNPQILMALTAIIFLKYVNRQRISLQGFSRFVLQKFIVPDSVKVTNVSAIIDTCYQNTVSKLLLYLSGLGVFSQIFERIIQNKIYKYLVFRNLVFSKQFDFQITVFLSMLFVAINRYVFYRNQFVLHSPVDLLKTFDSENNESLHYKLEYCWITSSTLK